MMIKRRYQVFISSENDKMAWSLASVTEEQKKGFNATFLVTGNQWFLGGKLGFDVRKVEFTWNFYSTDYAKIPIEFMVNILRDEYSVDIEPPKPIGAVESFKLKRIKE